MSNRHSYSGPTNCGTTVVIMAEVLRFGEILPNIVDCLNQAADFLTPFSNLIPANTPQLIPSH